MSWLAIQATNLTYRVPGETLLDSINLTVSCGESLAIVGPSGSGKTTLLNCLAGLVDPSEGDVQIGGETLRTLSKSGRARLRLDSIGMIYQFGELIPELTVSENILLPAILAGVKPSIYNRHADNLMDSLGIAGLSSRVTIDLSGGERQRVGIARALIRRPSLVLADEPTGALDSLSAARIAEILFGLPSSQDCALIVVTHDQTIARRSQRMASLEAGQLADVAS